MLGIVLVLLLLWKTKTLTQQRVIAVCAICAFVFTFLQEYGLGASGQKLLEATAIGGTIWCVVFCLVSWLVFRKKIKAGELARKLADEADNEHDEDED